MTQCHACLRNQDIPRYQSRTGLLERRPLVALLGASSRATGGSSLLLGSGVAVGSGGRVGLGGAVGALRSTDGWVAAERVVSDGVSSLVGAGPTS